jgi:(2Fe-2S) ferredoxin
MGVTFRLSRAPAQGRLDEWAERRAGCAPMPHRDRYLFVCTNRREEGHPKGSCAQHNSEEILKALKAGLLARGLAKTLRACSASCLDLCEVGAAIVVEPDHVVYGNVTLGDVDAIVEALATGNVVERLVVARPAREV